jgi:hypothetical protein
MYPRYGDVQQRCCTVLGERRMRKEGTDVGWRLRADLHHDGDPSGLPFGRHPRCFGSVRSPSAKATAPCWERREVSRSQVNASREEVLRSDRLLVERDLVRVLVACGQGKPESAGRARKSSQRDPHRRCHANDACAWCRKGGNAPPSPVAHALSLRDTQGEFPPFVHAGSSVGRRFPSLRVRTVRKGAGPSDGVRLPTRSKPSKGVALVGM